MYGRDDGGIDGWMNRKMDEWTIDEWTGGRADRIERMGRWSMHGARCTILDAPCTNARMANGPIHLSIYESIPSADPS
jgi:hypothetical protein